MDNPNFIFGGLLIAGTGLLSCDLGPVLKFSITRFVGYNLVIISGTVFGVLQYFKHGSNFESPLGLPKGDSLVLK